MTRNILIYILLVLSCVCNTNSVFSQKNNTWKEVFPKVNTVIYDTSDLDAQKNLIIQNYQKYSPLRLNKNIYLLALIVNENKLRIVVDYSKNADSLTYDSNNSNQKLNNTEALRKIVDLLYDHKLNDNYLSYLISYFLEKGFKCEISIMCPENGEESHFVEMTLNPNGIIEIEEFNAIGVISEEILKSAIKQDNPYFELDKQAEFPGGIPALMNWLSNTIIYPAEAHENKIEGKVIVKFKVKKDGTVGDIQIASGVNKLLDEEAVRVVSLMPSWIPAENFGEPVDSYFNLPITFHIPEENVNQ